MGPEVNLLVPALRSKLGVRVMRDFGARSRPEGALVVASLSVVIWQPDPPPGRPHRGRIDSAACHPGLLAKAAAHVSEQNQNSRSR